MAIVTYVITEIKSNNNNNNIQSTCYIMLFDYRADDMAQRLGNFDASVSSTTFIVGDYTNLVLSLLC